MAAPAGQLLPIPPGVTLKDAASLPEVACTVWSTVFMTSRLSRGETLLVGINLLGGDTKRLKRIMRQRK